MRTITAAIFLSLLISPSISVAQSSKVSKPSLEKIRFEIEEVIDPLAKSNNL